MTTTPPRIEWIVPIYRGLFHPAGQRIVRATSRYEAECHAQEHLAPDEWFPTFSAAPLAIH